MLDGSTFDAIFFLNHTKGKIEQLPLLKLFSFFQAYSLLQRIVKAGGHRGLQECERQFKNEVWNCSINGKHVVRELPIFVKTTLPQGKTTSHIDDVFKSVPPAQFVRNRYCYNQSLLLAQHTVRFDRL